MEIFSDSIPNKIETFRDKDPPWMNDDIKSKMKLKHKFDCPYLRHRRNNKDFVKLEYLRHEIDNLTSKCKKEYCQDINRKLNDLLRRRKTYWSIMKTLFYGKKTLVIPLLLFNGASVTDFQIKQISSIPFLQSIVH